MPRKLSAPRLIFLGFAAFIALGTLLLKLPTSTPDTAGISWLDAFFTSASAVTVTGLQVVPAATAFSPFGQAIIAGLVQVGGIGIMTATTVGALLLGGRVGFRHLLVVRQELQSPGSPRSVLRLVGQIALITILLELVAAAILAAHFLGRGFEPGRAAGYALFHSISAFCNAGFDVFGRGMARYDSDVVVNLVFVALIILGGLGFPVLVNLYSYRRVGYLTLHSKLVLVPTAALVALGVLGVAALEWTNPATLGGERFGTKVLESVFQGVTPRTAGFATVDYAELRDSTVLLQIALMFVGAAPASTGGGIKVTTVAFIFLILASQMRGEEEVYAFRRRIPRALIAKALSVLALAIVIQLVGTVALVASDGLALREALFEVTSALGTVGLSLGPTPELSPFGKLLLVVLMFVGRLGPITLVLALAARSRRRRHSYPEEEIAIG